MSHSVAVVSSSSRSSQTEETMMVDGPVDKVDIPLVRDEEIWMSDGNIVIAVPSPDAMHLFKCHRSVLSKHSPIFADMFTVPQMDRAEEYDNLSMVKMQDSHEDVRQLLRVLYDPTKQPHRKHDSDTLPSVAGVLRLSNKYEMTDIRSHFLELLQADWPLDLEAWDQNEDEIEQIRFSILREFGGDVNSQLPEPAGVIRLAYDIEAYEILPAAFYHLNRSCIPDTSDPVWPPEYSPARQRRFAQSHLLTKDDFHRLNQGKYWLQETLGGFLWSTPHSMKRHTPCKNQQTCADAVESFWLKYRSTIGFKQFLDPLAGLVDLIVRIEKLPETGEICKSCRQFMKLEAERKREEIWHNLPKFFDLPVQMEDNT